MRSLKNPPPSGVGSINDPTEVKQLIKLGATQEEIDNEQDPEKASTAEENRKVLFKKVSSFLRSVPEEFYEGMFGDGYGLPQRQNREKRIRPRLAWPYP